MVRDSLKPLVYLASGVLILLGVVFIFTILGIINSLWAILWGLNAILLPAVITMLYYLIRRSRREKTAFEALCAHLRLIGLDATVEWKEQKVREGALGAVRVKNRNIDLVELELARYYSDESGPAKFYRCNFVVQAKVEGLEDRLKAECKTVTVKKGFLRSEIVDFEWEGKELAQILNSDAKLRDTLYRVKNVLKFGTGAPYVRAIEIRPCREHQCIKIRQRFPTYSEVYAAFPTVETFEAYDRIAKHIRSFCSASSVGMGVLKTQANGAR